MTVINILVVCFVATACAKGPLKPFVSGGFRATGGLSPWHAGIYTKTTSPYMQICGGTLVSKNVVISAAHCFTKTRQLRPVKDYAVAVGKIYRPWNDSHDTGAQKSDVKEIRIPPRYQGATANFQDDIALVIAASEFHHSFYVMPACISFDDSFDDEQLQEGNVGKIVGWGLTSENGLPSQVLQAASLPSVAIDKCIEESPEGFKSSITGDKICAGRSNGTAVCRGDSGGGLVFPSLVDGVNRFFLRGVVSTSPSSEDSCNIYTWATFTHVLRHEHFISAVVPEPDESCLPKASDEMTEDRFAQTTELPRRSRCKCTCPAGTRKTRHGFCKRL